MTAPTRSFITIVSGLPRSGTSLAMQMLSAGGIPALTDARRTPDADNPRGYFEFERVKQIKSDQLWLNDAVGKAVKVIHMLITALPTDREYRVLMMRRDVNEVVRSQAAMLARSGKPGGGLSPEKLAQVYEGQMSAVGRWLAACPSFRVLDVHYAELIKDPRAMSEHVSEFLGGGLSIDAMARAVDPTLYRQRAD
jgi:hypothetical protein